MQLYSNYAQTYITPGITDTATTMVCATTDGGLFSVPVDQEFELLTLTDGTYWEVVKVTSRVDDTFTIERGHEGAARAWADNTILKSTVTEDTLDRFLQKEQIGAAMHLFAYQNYR